jgi:hypothetical protein
MSLVDMNNDESVPMQRQSFHVFVQCNVMRRRFDTLSLTHHLMTNQ